MLLSATCTRDTPICVSIGSWCPTVVDDQIGAVPPVLILHHGNRPTMRRMANVAPAVTNDFHRQRQIPAMPPIPRGYRVWLAPHPTVRRPGSGFELGKVGDWTGREGKVKGRSFTGIALDFGGLGLSLDATRYTSNRPQAASRRPLARRRRATWRIAPPTAISISDDGSGVAVAAGVSR